ncbi:hypothetical protein MalM25_01900 [Planctomycetes bacterium MalM25]|nr:hypothetical protein MalM25_01900 [Planctomycetes bacterium MalM25]
MTTTVPPVPPSPHEVARRDYRGFRRLAVILLALAAAGPLSLNLVDPDLWGHVRYGQDWIADGQIARTATHTYTAVGHPWINHENLAEWLLARGVATVGVTGLLLAKLALGMAVLLLMWSTAHRNGVRPIAAWACFVLVAYNLQAFFPMRPQLLSFLWCAAMLFALDRAFAGWGQRQSDLTQRRRESDPPLIDWRWLAVLPPLFAVWVNSHGGFVAGGAILTAVLVGRAIELFVRQGRDAAPRAIGLAAILLASGAATLLNPYGAELHAWLLGSLGEARPEITEWGPPTRDNPVFWPFVALTLLASVTLTMSDRRRDPVQVIVLALVGWQAASHLRHIAFFALLCGFWLPPHLQTIAARLRNSAAEGLPIMGLSPWLRRGLSVALFGAIALQSAYLGQRLASFPVPRSHYPVDALQWMSDQRVRGDLVVCFNWAQYAIASLAPDVRVSFDGRFRTCYPQAVIDRHFDFLVGDNWPRHRGPDSGPIDGARTLEVDHPDYVLVDRKYANAVEVMAQASSGDDSEWSLVYQDAVARVYGRREVVDELASDRYIPASRRWVSEHFSLTAVEWPALPQRRALSNPNKTPSRVAESDGSAEDERYHDG